jgi:hypothetical protein
MAAPTAYTEEMLREYMQAELGAVVTALGWSLADGNYDEPVNETLLAYGVASIALATEVRKLRALARREAWRTAAAQAAGMHDFSADGSSFSLAQIQEMALKALALAESEAARYEGAFTVTPIAVHYGDPYEPLELTE